MKNISWSKKRIPGDSIYFNYIGSFVYRDQKTIAEYTANGEWQETKSNLNKEELYLPVLKYLDENYKDFNFIEAKKVTRSDKKDYYYVHLEQLEKEQTRPFKYELFFNKAGKLDKINRPEDLKEEFLLTEEIPDEIAKKFNSRFARAEDVAWTKGEGEWTSKFYYRNLPTTAIYTDSAEWIMTVVDLDVKQLYAPIQRNIDENYKEYKVTSAQKATRQDRNDYYLVTLTAKKKTVEPQNQELRFNKTGKLIEEQDE